MNCGIYKITNINGKIYVGSSIHLEVRWNEHLRTLRSNSYEHTNHHLQSAWNKYGENSFIFEVLLYCAKENLAFYEQRAIDECKSLDGKFGYNMMLAKRTDLTGSNAKERGRKISEAKKGKHPSKETKKKISETLIRKELFKGKNNYMYGKHPSKEMIEKGRQTQIKNGKNKGKNNPNAKAVITNFKHYNTITEAALESGISRTTIRRRIQTNKQGYSWTK